MSNQRRVRKVINRKQHDSKVLEFVEAVTQRLDQITTQIELLEETLGEFVERVNELENRVSLLCIDDSDLTDTTA